MSTAKYNQFPTGHSLRKVHKIAEEIDWNKLNFFSLNVLPRLEKNSDCKHGKSSHHHLKNSIGMREMMVLLVEGVKRVSGS